MTMPYLDVVAWLLPLLVIAIVVALSIRILREYERGVVFTLGRLQAVKGPGLILVVPVVQTMERVDMRTRVLDVPPQDVISRDTERPTFTAGRMPWKNRSVSRKIWPSVMEMTLVGM